ncbi:MAG: hypothetical protein ACE5H0_04030 [Bacteroidota bacterium]
MKHFNAAYHRGLTIQAAPGLIFRWLCQMRIAPYSYDWIDNFGRQSPRTLIPRLDELTIGQRFMGIFELVDFECDRHLTIRMRPNTTASRVFGDLVVSYLIVPQSVVSCRLLVKLVVRYPRGPVGWFMRVFLPWGDLMMMRRQLLNFKILSEQRPNGL